MDKSKLESIEVLDDIIEGRVDPYIYAFKTNTVPDYLKIGDTYRPVSQRLNEWRRFFPELEKQYENKAIIDQDNYFRDFSVHKYLENDLHKIRLLPRDLEDDIYYSREFFRNTEKTDVDIAIQDIKENFKNNTGKYEYYSALNKLPKTYHYKRGEDWELRPNQQEVVDNFAKAVSNGRTNLLMYAVMRFGKSFTSLCCALKIGANLVLVVSAKADVKDEWKQTVESAGNFKEYKFLESDDLSRDENAIDNTFLENKKVILFLTLQDLQGKDIKEKHKQVLSKQIDLLIIDETHFGARAESFGRILKNSGYDLKDEKNIKRLKDDHVETIDAEEEIKKLNANIRLHLSGTPYRILMGSEFEEDDIIAFVQFADIVKEQEKWDENNLYKDDTNEWDNPYFGFPQMVRFAFNPNKSSRQKMEELKRNGISFAFSKLFEPKSITLDKKEESHKKFVNKKEILDLLQVIDGSKEDEDLLGFLDYDKIKEGKMCRHIVMVLPYCASCDAMEELIKSNKNIFKNLGSYEIINISGLESSKKYKTPNDIKNKIAECESDNKKTITLTVNRMLTGSTVKQWDTMLYFKDTASPQEYDQSIFRLQNQYTRTLVSGSRIIKENLKPQTLLVDFDPNRLFKMHEQKSLIYNVNTDNNGNSKLKERIEEEIRISPIIMMNHNKIQEVTATNILEAISEYHNNRSVTDEVSDIPVDLSILNNDEIRKTIESQGEFNSNKGLTINPNQGEGEDIDLPDPGDIDSQDKDKKQEKKEDYIKTKPDNEVKKLANQIKTYYQRILFYSFLTKDRVASLDDILRTIKSSENIRLAKNLYLDIDVLEKFSSYMDPFKRSRLDYKIQNISKLANDESIPPIERAMTSIKKFDRMSESEVVTPAKVCVDMINLLPEDGLRKIVDKNDKFIDMGCKAGEYAVAIYNRLTEGLSYSHHEIKDLIYAIPTSSIAYEFTRKFYEILGLNLENIATKFNAYDLLKIKDKNGSIDYENIKNILEQDYKFSDIKLEENANGGEKKVEFGAVVGNPPYQISDGGAQASAKPIYQHFVNIGIEMSSEYVTCITPSRWFSGGKGLDKYREKMIESNKISILVDFPNSESIFNGVFIKGGCSYFLYDNNYYGDTKIITQNNGSTESMNRKLSIPGINIVVRYNWQYTLLNKVFNTEFDPFSNKVSSRKPYGYINNKLIKNIKEINDYPIYSNKIRGFINKKYINISDFQIKEPKIFITYAYGAGEGFPHQIINKPIIPEDDAVCTETYILINGFKNNEERDNAYKYMNSKFFRALVSTIKISQHATAKVYNFVPIQDFTKKSDIDWSKSIDEIDEQLFDKYQLSEEERNHIKSSIKDM